MVVSFGLQINNLLKVCGLFLTKVNNMNSLVLFIWGNHRFITFQGHNTAQSENLWCKQFIQFNNIYSSLYRNISYHKHCRIIASILETNTDIGKNKNNTVIWINDSILHDSTKNHIQFLQSKIKNTWIQNQLNLTCIINHVKNLGSLNGHKDRTFRGGKHKSRNFKEEKKKNQPFFVGEQEFCCPYAK